jgi:hypothetical protein
LAFPFICGKLASLDKEQMAELVKQISDVMQSQVDKHITTLSEKFGEIENRLESREGGSREQWGEMDGPIHP